jgi:hypothetical protein
VEPHSECNERRAVDQSEQRGKTVGRAGDQQRGDEHDVFEDVGGLNPFGETE